MLISILGIKITKKVKNNKIPNKLIWNPIVLIDPIVALNQDLKFDKIYPISASSYSLVLFD